MDYNDSAPELGWDPDNPFPELALGAPTVPAQDTDSDGAPAATDAAPEVVRVRFHDAGVTPTLNPYTGAVDLAAAQAAQEAATYEETHGRYHMVGRIDSESLLAAPPGAWNHLDDRLERTVAWVQDYLTQNNWSERIAAVREHGTQSPEYAPIVTEIDRLALQYVARENFAHGSDQAFILAAVVDEIIGLGPIEPLLRDPRVTEVMVNGPGAVYVEISGRVRHVPGARFRSRDHLMEMCQRILRPINRSIDQRNAYEDGRLPDGSRVNVVHHALAADGPVLTIRRFPDKVWTLTDLINLGSLTADMACVIAGLVKHRVNIIVAGGTGSGKTALLNSLSGAIPRGERVITIEDSRELRLHPAAHWVALEGRPKSASGEGSVSIRELVKNALRMRPTRIIVGEVRDSAALDMLNAMNTGHEGSLTTLHANGPEETIDRLLVMIAQGGEIPPAQAVRLVASAVDIIMFQERLSDGSRRVTSIHEVIKPDRRQDIHDIQLMPLWEWVQTGTDPDGRITGVHEHRNDMSAELVRIRKLAFAEPVTLEEVHAMSNLDATNLASVTDGAPS